MYLAPVYILILFIDPQGVRLGTKSRGPEPQDKKPSRDHIPQHPQAKLNLELNICGETINEDQNPIVTTYNTSGYWGRAHTQVLLRGPASNRLKKKSTVTQHSHSPPAGYQLPAALAPPFFPFLEAFESMEPV